MKKIYPLLIALILFSCQKENMFDKMEGDGTASNSQGQTGDSLQIEPGQITAGEWNDLENWYLWDTLIHGQTYSNMSDYWNISTDGKIIVQVENQEGLLLSGIQLLLTDKKENSLWSARTDNQGVAALWYKPFHWSGNFSMEDLLIRIDDELYEPSVHFFDNRVNLTINGMPDDNQLADIAFMVDATGSMSDELEYLKVELMDVIDRVKQQHPDIDLAMGSVFYRDEGDKYVTRKSDFSGDINKTVDFIKDQRADGGGDFPEAVHTALDESVNTLEWRDEADTKLLFMVLDAPPHYEDQIVTSYQNRIEDAAGQGIKLIPVVASGIDKQTEFLMRYSAILTNGTYVFITDHSGIGRDHLEPTVGQYEVEMLNNLLVRLITENIGQ